MSVKEIVRKHYIDTERSYPETFARTWKELNLDKAKCPGLDKEILHDLLRNAIWQVIYAVAKPFNDAARHINQGGESGESGQGGDTFEQKWRSKQKPARKLCMDAIAPSVMKGILYGWCPNGKPIAEMTLAEVLVWEARYKGAAVQNRRNAAFFTWIAGQMSEDGTVIDHVDPEEAEQTWKRILEEDGDGGEGSGETQDAWDGPDGQPAAPAPA